MLLWLSFACQNTIQDIYEVSAEEFDFGEVSQGMWLSNGIRVLNTGAQDLKLVSVSIAENGSDVFSFEGEKPDVLLTGEAAIFDIIFTPDDDRRFEAQFILQTSSEEIPTARIALYGEGGPSIHDTDGDGFAPTEGDCDDTRADVYPGAIEVCDGVDTDCDGDFSTEEFDSDGDGWRQCDGDCDDSDNRVYPGAAEICDGKDSDCNGAIEDDIDFDGDGRSECDGDCDDEDAQIYAGAAEVCDYVDNDCNGLVDDVDSDGDGFPGCASGGDCDDNFYFSHPVVLDTNAEPGGDGSFETPFHSLNGALENINAHCRKIFIVPGTHEIESSWAGSDVLLLGGGEYPEDTTLKPFSTSSRALRVLPGADLQMENLTAFGGDSQIEGGFLRIDEGAVVEVNNTVFFDNHSAEGGAIFVEGGTLIAVDSEFSYNSSTGKGGAIFLQNGELFDDGSVFVANEAASGGAIASIEGVLSLQDSRVKSNTATEGGGLYLEDMLSFSFSNVALLNNEALEDGGGMAIVNPGSEYVLRRILAQGNEAAGNGGAISITGQQSAGLVANNSFVDNSAGLLGGAMYMNPISSAGGNWFWSNIIAYGGGVYLSPSSAGHVSHNLCWESTTCLALPQRVDSEEQLDVDPMFINFIDDGNLAGDNLGLEIASPAIDSGPQDGDGPTWYQVWLDADGSHNDRGHTGGVE